MPPRLLRVGSFTPSLLLYSARASGKFDRANLEIVETPVASSPAQFRSLEAGELDVALTSPDNVVAYRFLSHNPLGRNLPLQLLGALDRGLGLSLCLAPSLRSAPDVRGRVLGVDVPESGFAFVAYELLRREGLEVGDYSIEALGSTPRRAIALIGGECDATILNAGNELRASGAGCTIVSRASELGPYLGTVVAALTTRDSAVASLRRLFMDVLVECANEILAGQHQSDLLTGARSLLGLSEDEARAHYACLREPATGLIADGVVDRLSIETLITLRQRYLPTPELDTIMQSFETLMGGDVSPR